MQPVTIANIPVPFVSEVKNLGVYLSYDLSWKRHISYVSQKVHFALNKLKFNKNSLSTALRIKIVTTLVLPHIDYCCLVYHGLSSEMNTKLQRLVNCSIRFIFNLKFDEHVTPYRRCLGWLSVENRRRYFLGCQTYRIIYMNSPSYLNELFTVFDPEQRRSERLLTSSHIFHIPQFRTTTYRNSFHLSMIFLWHSLPSNITSAAFFSAFEVLRRYLLDAESLLSLE